MNDDAVRAQNLESLGSGRTTYAYNCPDPKVLECFDSPFDNSLFIPDVVIKVPEFTSLCPKTGQPDFATIVIKYTPNKLCVESKSLKLYLMGFRMFGEFHESCVNRIAKDLVDLLHPQHLSVEGQFTPRGGIPFWPRVEYWEPLVACENESVTELRAG